MLQKGHSQMTHSANRSFTDNL